MRREPIIDEPEPVLKFNGCDACANARRARICTQCDVGEFFEEVEPAGIDALFVS